MSRPNPSLTPSVTISICPHSSVRQTGTSAFAKLEVEELGAGLRRLRLFSVYTNLWEHKSDHVAVFPRRTPPR